jgi:hypothetical protein
MTDITAITDERLFELLREADPLADGPRPAVESQALGIDGKRLLQHVLASERLVQRPTRRRVRLRRRLVLSAASSGGVAAAVAAALVFTAGNAPSVAFAGWSADPTAPASGGEVQAAEAECQRNAKLVSLKPALADVRGPYTLLVYAENGGSLCMTGPSLQSPTGEPHIIFFGSFLSASDAAEQGAAMERGTQSNSQGQEQNSTTLTPATIRTVAKGLAVLKASASAPSAEYGFDAGQAGNDVTAVTLVLKGGSHVEATTANGWFAAWWPGGEEAQTAEVTTTNGVTIQRLTPSVTP